MTRTLQITTLCFLALYLIGCKGSQQRKPFSEQVKIGDISPSDGNNQSFGSSISTIDFDVHIFEIPAENIDKLNDIPSVLRANYGRPMRFNNPNAFSANSFSVCFGQIPMWKQVGDLLLAAGGQKITTASLLLADGVAESVVVSGLDSPRTIFFISIRGTREGANVGPGILALRIKAEKIPGLRSVCNVDACPVFSPPILGSSIPQLAALTKRREFLFTSAAFGLRMSPGDFVFLGPGKYTDDQTALGGLFFSKPEGSLFLSATERKGPEQKPAVRVFLLVCTGIND